MITIIVTGAAGRMGRAVIECAHADQDFSIAAGLEAAGHAACGTKDQYGVLITDDHTMIKKADVVIDFTFPAPALQYLHHATEYRKAMVIGTTGFSHAQMGELKKCSNDIPVLVAPNMSTGVNVLYALAEKAARLLQGYDIEIIEAHHNKKKDAPSGTANQLADILSAVTGCHDMSHGREGSDACRPSGQIGMHAVRAGDIVGDHTVLFAGQGERIELIHRAHSRATLAAGALKAAKWLKNKKPGLYTMKNVLGISKHEE